MNQKKYRKKMLKRLAPLGVIAGGSVAASLIGAKMPTASSRLPLENVGSTLGSMAKPVAVVTGGAMAMDAARMLPKYKKKKKRRYRKW